MPKASGFTLIELLVVIIIIGILSAIALPSFLNQANRAKQSEALQTVGAIVRAQQAYYLERGQFVVNVSNIGQLGLGIKTETSNFSYSIEPVNGGEGAAHIATPKSNSVKAFLSGIGLVWQPGSDQPTTLTVLCQADYIGPTPKLTSANLALTTGNATSPGNIGCAGQTNAVQ